MNPFFDLTFSLYLCIAWIVFSLFWAVKDKLPTDIAVFLFTLMSMLQSIVFTILTLSLKWLSFPQNPETFITLLLFRNVVHPLLFLFFGMALFQWNTFWKRWGSAAGIVLLSLFMDWISVQLGLLTFERYSYWLLFLVQVLFLTVAYWAMRWFLWVTNANVKEG